jgi:hypothetical protein
MPPAETDADRPDASGRSPRPTPPLRLSYERGPHRRRRRYARYAVLLALVVLAGIAWRSREDISAVHHRLRVMRVESAWRSYDPPADQVVYEEEPAAAAALLGAGGGYVNIWPFPEQGGVIAAKRLGFLDDRYVFSWDDRQHPASAPLFVGELRTPEGNRRLVAVEYTWNSDYFRTLLYTWKVEPTTLFEDGQEGGIIGGSGKSSKNFVHRDFRFFAGRKDPSDESRFIIAYEIDGHRGHIDGQLVDQGRNIELTVRDGDPGAKYWPGW